MYLVLSSFVCTDILIQNLSYHLTNVESVDIKSVSILVLTYRLVIRHISFRHITNYFKNSKSAARRRSKQPCCPYNTLVVLLQ